MSAEAIEHVDPLLSHRGLWTERDYFALDEEDGQRVELIEGALLLSPHADTGHQRIGARLWRELEEFLPEDIEAVIEANVRLVRETVVIPDVVVTRDLSGLPAIDVSNVLLVAEVVSPSDTSRRRDRILKPALYADAGVPWFLRVEQEPRFELILHRLEHGAYVEHARATVGERLELPGLGGAIEVNALRRRR